MRSARHLQLAINYWMPRISGNLFSNAVRLNVPSLRTYNQFKRNFQGSYFNNPYEKIGFASKFDYIRYLESLKNQYIREQNMRQEIIKDLDRKIKDLNEKNPDFSEFNETKKVSTPQVNNHESKTEKNTNGKTTVDKVGLFALGFDAISGTESTAPKFRFK